MYGYRVTVESAELTAQSELSEARSMQFQIQNHDDLFKVVETIRSKEILDADRSASLAIGLKLFAEIVLEKRRDPLFEPLLGPMQSFIRQLKAVETTGVVEAHRKSGH